MKLYLLIIISSLIVIIKTVTYCDASAVVTKVEDCNNLKCSSQYNYCCYFEGTWNGAYKKSCIDLSPVRKDETDNYIKEINANEGYNVEKIQCNSIINRINIVCLLLFILLN